MHGDDVRRGHELVERVDELDAEGMDPLLGGVLAILPDREDGHAERASAFGHREPDLAEPDDPDGLPEHAVRLPVRGLVPRAGPQIRDVVGDPPVDRQQEPHRELGDGDRVATGDVRDVDPDLGRGLDVDRVGARAGPHDQLQRVRRLDGRGCHLRAPNDQRLEPPDPAREIVAREGRFRDALVTEIGQGDARSSGRWHRRGGRASPGAKQNRRTRNKPEPLRWNGAGRE